MSQPAVPTELEPDEAQALRAWAAEERARADSLASVLESIAVNGLPEPAECVPWEDIRASALDRLGGSGDAPRGSVDGNGDQGSDDRGGPGGGRGGSVG